MGMTNMRFARFVALCVWVLPALLPAAEDGLLSITNGEVVIPEALVGQAAGSVGDTIVLAGGTGEDGLERL